MAVLPRQVDELRRFRTELYNLLHGMRAEITRAQTKVNTIRNGAHYRESVQRLSLESQMAALRAQMKRLKELTDADAVMRANPGKFSTTTQASAYNRRMTQILSGDNGRMSALRVQFGDQGAAEINSAEARERFRRDSLSDFDSIFESMKERYGGDSGLADRRMRDMFSKNLPDFFKNSKLSTKNLKLLSGGFARFFPSMSNWMKMANQLGPLGKLVGGSFGMAAGVVKTIIDKVISVSKDRVTRDAHARYGGMDSETFLAANSVLAATGGSAESVLSHQRNWKSSMGRLFRGQGGTEFMEGLAAYGIDISGSGKGGLATAAEIRNRTAKKIAELRSSGDEDGAMALAQQAGFDEHMYYLSLRAGAKGSEDGRGGVNGVLGMNKGRATRRIVANVDEAYNTALTVEAAKLYAEAAKTTLVDTATFSLHDSGSSLDDIHRKGASNARASESAARSADRFDANGGAAAMRGEGVGKRENTNVSFTIGTLEMTANDPKEMERKLVERAARESRMDVVRKFDSGMEN